MDDIIVKPRNPRYNIPNKSMRRLPKRLHYKKRGKRSAEDSSLAETILKQLVLSIIIFSLIFAVKSINSPITNFLSDKIKLVVSSNIDLTKVYDSIDSAIKKITGNQAAEENGTDLQNTPDNPEIPVDYSQENATDDQAAAASSDLSDQAIDEPLQDGMDYDMSDDQESQDTQDTDTQDNVDESSESSQKTTGQGTQKTTTQSTKKTTAISTDSKLIASIKSTYTFAVPVSGSLSSPYGKRIDPRLKVEKFHKGVDIAANKGMPIKAALAGTVIVAGTDSSYGNYLEIDHDNGLLTLYAHCSKLLVKKGQKVKKGDIIAKVGDTGAAIGPHLHFEVLKDGKNLNPLEFIKVPVKV